MLRFYCAGSPKLAVAKVPVIGVDVLLAESGGIGDGFADGLNFFIWAFILAKWRSYSHAAC